MVSTTDEVISEAAAVDVQQMQTNEIKTISEEEFEKAQKTYQLGKKNLFLSKYDESVNNIGDACKIFSAKYGEMDPQCAEVYFFYGRALLELARVENTVLGNALNGVPEDTSPINDSRYGNPEDVAADEKKEISDKVIDALCEASDEAEKKAAEMKGVENGAKDETKAETTEEKPVATEEAKTTETTTTETNGKSEEVKESPTNDEATEEESEEGDEEVEGEVEGEEDITKGEDGQAKEDPESDEISNLQSAWEMFELAKLIYSKNFDNDLVFKNKRVAECLLKLGEISIEQEVYEQAINDIKESIKIQEEEAKENRDERMLAESFYQLGLSQQFNNQFNEANESYQKSINIVQLRIEKLKGKLEMSREETDDLEKNSIKDEIGELEALLPEMTAKLEEVNEQGQQSLTLIKEAKECFLNNIESKNGASASNGDVKDITSLVKSKRKISSSQTDECNASVKKTRLSEELSGGEAVQNKEEKIEVDESKPEETTVVKSDENKMEEAPSSTTNESEEKKTAEEVSTTTA